MHRHWSNPLQTLAITIPFSLESSLRNAIQAFSRKRHWSNPLQTLAITIPFSLESSLRSAIQAFSSPRSSALNSRTSASTPETKKRPISNITPSTTSTRSSLSAMMHYNASASEMTASSAAAVPFFAFPITFSRRCSPLVCLPLAVDASSASKQSGPTLIALAATSSSPRDSACPTYTVMTRSASLTSIAAARAPPCGTNRCFSQNMAPMFRSTLPPFHPNFDFLLPSLATPPALKPPARLSPSASSVGATFSATASLLPNLHGASLSSLSLIGNLTLITPVVVIPPMTLMTSMTSTRRSTGETYPLECLCSLTPMREQAGRTAPLPAF